MIDCAVILAIGSPAHQSQLIYNRPRAMLPALGRPMAVRMMDRLYRNGIQNYVVVVGEDEGAIASYLNAHWVPDVKIEFVLQSARDPLKKTLANIARKQAKPFLISAYNAFTHPNFPERLFKHYQELGDALYLTATPNTLSKSPQHRWALTTGRQVVDVVDSSPASQHGLMLADLMLCGESTVRYLESHSETVGRGSERELMTIVRDYVQSGALTYAVDAAWTLQVETDHDLLTLNMTLLDEEQDAHILSELPGTVQIVPPVRIDPQVSVGQGAKIGPYVYLESGSSIGHHAVVSHSLVLQKAVVPAEAVISNRIMSTRVQIQA